MTIHQQKQIEVVNKIEEQIKNNSLGFSTVSPVNDYDNDPRLCLTAIHLPNHNLLEKIQQSLINPLKRVAPGHYYYDPSSLHITIKSVRIINDPPHFTPADIEKAKQVFAKIIPGHHQYKIRFYRLLLLPSNLSLVGITDPELDSIHLDLDQELNKAGIPDDKKYVSPRYFFGNITLVRFLSPLTEEYKQTVNELSRGINFKPYTVDSVTLLTCNAALKKKTIIGTWPLCAV